MHVAVIETGGNQRYIFATNRVREQVGASELIHRVGTSWVKEALEKSKGVEVITSTSGKAVLRAAEAKPLEDLVWRITSRALAEAPGLHVNSIVRDIGSEALGAGVSAAYRVLPTWNPNAGRLAQQPALEVCTSSGGVGQRVVRIGDNDQVVSSEIVAKRAAFESGLSRMVPGATASDNLGALEERYGAERFAVVHADGNGLGRIFLNLHQITEDDDQYVSWSQLLSAFIEKRTKDALKNALDALGSSDNRPSVVPIVLGGDDVTLVCDARWGLAFTCAYLKAFEHAEIAAPIEPILRAAICAGLLGGDPKHPKLTASAGIAIVKPHHPFWAAYELAADLTTSAKTVKQKVKSFNGTAWPVSSLDVHVLLDSRTDGLGSIRAKMRVNGTFLCGGPWLIGTESAQIPPCDVKKNWWAAHQYQRLVDAVKVVSRDEEGRRSVPGSQLHTLRTALTRSRNDAEETYRPMLSTYRDMAALGFNDESTNEVSVYDADGATLVLDALALEGLM